MKRLILAVMLAFAPLGASAQVRVPTQRPPPAPLGPFAISMTTEEARAATPGVEWQVVYDDVLQRGSMQTIGAGVELHGVPFQVLLTYGANAVSVARLSAELPLSDADCRARHRDLVVTEAREDLGMRDYWHRFYEHPDGPSGRMNGAEFEPATNFDARGVAESVPIQGLTNPISIGAYRAPRYDQSFYSAKSNFAEITASSFARAGAPVCQISMQISWVGGGFMVNNGPSGPERLAERLAAAEFVRPVTYLTIPDPMNLSRYYPEAAMIANVEGDVTMDCLVLADGKLDCVLREETPPEYGFGDVVRRFLGGYRVNVFEGAVAGKRTEITIRFRLPS
ncbi:MAG: hypothetical protein ABL889_11625 [Terricaulis sp.]